MAEKRNIVKILAGISLFGILLAGVLPPIPQDPQYHQFADTATLLGIPNFWNVVSNLPFLVVGLLGLSVADGKGSLPILQAHYKLFFAGVFLTGLGSGYYHWHPDNGTLVWDRLPMTIAFMALLAIVIGEQADVRASRWLLWPLLFIGMASVGYWHWTESQGRGDLRLYGLVQFLPMLAIPLMLVLLPSRFATVRHLWWVIIFYGLSKALEYYDHGLFRLFGCIGGHPLKHIAAALGAYVFCLALTQRTLAPPPRSLLPGDSQ